MWWISFASGVPALIGWLFFERDTNDEATVVGRS